MVSKETRFILGMLKNHKKELSLIITLSFFGSVIGTAVPFLYGKIFDLAIVPKTTLNFLFSLIIIWFAMSLISTILSNKGLYFGTVLGTKLALKSEVDIYSHFMNLPIAFHKKQKKGEILEKVSRGSWEFEQLVANLSEILPLLLSLIFATGVLISIKKELAVLFVGLLFFSLTVALSRTKELLELQKKEIKEYEKRYGELYDKLYNIFLIKNFSTEEKESERLVKKFLNQLLEITKQNQKKWHSAFLLQRISRSTSLVILLGSAILLLKNGLISQGEFITFFGYVNMAFNPIGRLSHIYRNYRRSKIFIGRMLKLKMKIPEKMHHGNKKIRDFKGKISFKNVSFSFQKGRKILKGINLEIDAGESIAIVGKSGVGKTTLSELILGYYKPEKGKILLDGVEIRELDIRWLRKQIAIVPQDPSLFNATLLENIRYAKPNATMKEIIKACKAAHAHEFITKLKNGYKTVVGERGVRLSAGQRQRIAIAMAFLKSPRILILDEPTSALDAHLEKKIKKSIEELTKNRTALIIAHRLSTIKNVDRIIVLKKGKIVEEGKHGELIKKRGEYYRLYKTQFEKEK